MHSHVRLKLLVFASRWDDVRLGGVDQPKVSVGFTWASLGKIRANVGQPVRSQYGIQSLPQFS